MISSVNCLSRWMELSNLYYIVLDYLPLIVFSEVLFHLCVTRSHASVPRPRVKVKVWLWAGIDKALIRDKCSFPLCPYTVSSTIDKRSIATENSIIRLAEMSVTRQSRRKREIEMMCLKTVARVGRGSKGGRRGTGQVKPDNRLMKWSERVVIKNWIDFSLHWLFTTTMFVVASLTFPFICYGGVFDEG